MITHKIDQRVDPPETGKNRFRILIKNEYLYEK